MTFAENPSISVNLYASYLKQAHSTDDTQDHLKNNRFTALFGEKTASAQDKSFSPLTLREITLLGLEIKNDIIKSPEKAQLVSLELHRIAEQKKSKETQRYTVTRALFYVQDCFSNFWSGLGFKSTESITEELSQELAKYKPQKTDIQIVANNQSPSDIPSAPKSTPIDIPQPKPTHPSLLQQYTSSSDSTPSGLDSSPSSFDSSPPSSPESKPLLTRRTISGKNRALEAYKANPNKCYQIQKSIVFKNIRSIQKTDSRDIVSIVQLMEFVSDFQPYDLRNELCGQVVIDTLKECDIGTNDQLCDWLTKEETFNPQLLVRCLHVLIEKEKAGKVISLFTIESLFKIYSVNSWNRFISVNQNDIVMAISLLLRMAPNSTGTGVLLEWMMRQPEFSLESFIIFIRVFIEKEATLDYKNLFYPACDKLIEHVNEASDWKESIFSNTALKDIADYLRKKGIYASKEEQILLESQKKEQAASTIRQNPTKIQSQPLMQCTLIRKTSTAGKSRALQMYKKSPYECPQGLKNIIFKDIQCIEPPSSELDANEIISIVHLMKFITNQSEINLTHHLCSQIVLDTFKLCNKETDDRLAEWLVEQPTFNANLLIDCLDIFLEKDFLKTPFSFFAIEILLKKYKNESWNIDCQVRDLISGSHFHIVISSVVLLLKNNPNNDNIAQIILWLMEQSEFDNSAFCYLLLTFRNKERELGHITIHYPIRDQMIAHLHRAPPYPWARVLAQDKSPLAQETIDYICLQT